MNLRLLLPLSLTLTLIVSCGVKQSDYDSLKSELEVAKKKLLLDSVIISHLQDTIIMLSYPANQRFEKINSLVSKGDFDNARSEIHQLALLFPESKEAQAVPAISKKIDDLITKQKTEEDRIKALGFKVLKPCTSAEIGYNKLSFTNIVSGNTFVFDSYDDHYHYRTADRGNTYITAVMSVTSSSKDPDLPTLAVYSINGNQMKKEGVMELRFARWKNYGTYLGNYSDYGNDFAKTSTIRFKLGIEVSDDIVKKPYAVVLKKSNGLSRNYSRFDNPPVSYIGSISYPYSLSLDDFTRENSQYLVVKIANL